MYKFLEESHDKVVAVKTTGKLNKSDYDTLIPALENKIQQYGKINPYWEMEDFGWEPSGLWQDIKFDIKHVNDFNRVALVGDKKWEEWMTNLIKPFTSAEVKYFNLSERQLALQWVQQTA